MLHSHSSQLWLDPLLVPLSFEPFLISALKKIRSLFHDLTKMALKFKKIPQKSKWMNNEHMTTEKLQISADVNTTAQTRICWDRWAAGEDIKTRATISWIIEPLSKLRIYSNGSWPSVSQRLHTGMFWLMIEKKTVTTTKIFSFEIIMSSNYGGWQMISLEGELVVCWLLRWCCEKNLGS